jgi:hypothetical protein
VASTTLPKTPSALSFAETIIDNLVERTLPTTGICLSTVRAAAVPGARRSMTANH